MMAATGQSVLDRARGALIGNAGLIFCLHEFVTGPGEPRLFSVASARASLKKVLGVEIPGTEGAVGFSYEEAAAGAIGETIERYCAGYYEWDDLIYASFRSLDALHFNQKRRLEPKLRLGSAANQQSTSALFRNAGATGRRRRQAGACFCEPIGVLTSEMLERNAALEGKGQLEMVARDGIGRPTSIESVELTES